MTYEEYYKKRERNQLLALYIESGIVGFLSFFAIIGIALLLNGCGTGSSGDSGSTVLVTEDSAEAGTDAMAIATSADLPECGETNEDQLILTKDDKKFHVCESGSWTTIAIGGGSIAEQYVCGMSDDLDAGASFMYGTYLNATRFDNGDWHVSCAASDSTFLDAATHDAWFSAGSNAVNDGALGCIPPYVYASFEIDNGSVVYTDANDSTNWDRVQCTKIN